MVRKTRTIFRFVGVHSGFQCPAQFPVAPNGQLSRRSVLAALQINTHTPERHRQLPRGFSRHIKNRAKAPIWNPLGLAALRCDQSNT